MRTRVALLVGGGMALAAPACTVIFPLDEVKPSMESEGDRRAAQPPGPMAATAGDNSAVGAGEDGSAGYGMDGSPPSAGTEPPPDEVDDSAAPPPPVYPADLSMCEELSACGGDPVGTWDILGLCEIELSPEARDTLFQVEEESDECIDRLDLSGKLTGTVSFSAIDGDRWSVEPSGSFAVHMDVDVDVACVFDGEPADGFCDVLDSSPKEGLAGSCELEEYDVCHCILEGEALPLEPYLVPQVTAADVCVRGDQMMLIYRIPEDATYFVPLRRRR